MNTKLLTINKLANPQKDIVNEKIFKLSPNKTCVTPAGHAPTFYTTMY